MLSIFFSSYHQTLSIVSFFSIPMRVSLLHLRISLLTRFSLKTSIESRLMGELFYALRISLEQDEVRLF